MRVVIVNDDEHTLQAMKECVTRAGHEVEAFAYFEPAKSYITRTPIDVLVTEVRLGAFNGLQLAILAKLDRPQAIALVLSGSDDPVLRTEATNIGAQFVLKPIGPDQLLRAIQGSPAPAPDGDRGVRLRIRH